MLSITNLRKELRAKGSLERAEASKWFFKTGPGQYGEGDIFIGVKSADMRSLAKKDRELKLSDIQKLLSSKIHEERQVALIILVEKFQMTRSPTSSHLRGKPKLNRHRVSSQFRQKEIYEFYLKNTKYINNWDLVDLSAHKIVGEYLKDKSREPLYKLARSKSLWEKRISIISTFAFIREDDFRDALKIAEILLQDEHDLIHKAVGWMLREVGKKSLATEENFLKKHYKHMPRTMLRYAIERFPEKKRQAYLKGVIG